MNFKKSLFSFGLAVLLVASIMGRLQNRNVERALAAPAASTGFSSAFQVGEKLQYRISWNKIVVAGMARLEVRPLKSDSQCQFYLKVESTPAVATLLTLQDEFMSLYDRTLASPSRYEKRFTLNKQVVSEVVSFNQMGHSAQVVDSKKQTRKVPIVLGTQDPVSALYSVRNVGLKPGMQLRLPLLDGGRNYLLEVSGVATELITVQAGSFNSLRTQVSLQADGVPVPHRNMTIWLSDDSKHVPLLVSVALPIGTVLVELISMP